MTQDLPPTFEATNQVDLVSIESSKIINVKLYAGRAEITRLYKFAVQTGQNLVNINGLPNALDRDSLRVEGKGAATIHDVTISSMPNETNPEALCRLNDRLKEKKLLQYRLERCKKSLSALGTYLGSFNVEHTDSAQLGSILQHYDDVGETLNVKSIELEEKIQAVQNEIDKERRAISGTQHDNKLRLKASIGVFAASEGEVAIALIYAVNGANWTAGYDIRVDTDTKEKARLVYKAAISQNTGESWDDVELHLETAAPTFGVSLPRLSVQKLTSRDPNAPRVKEKARKAYGSSMGMAATSFLLDDEEDEDEDEEGEQEDADMELDEDEVLMEVNPFEEALAHRSVAVTPKGNINATFQVPGLSTLPSDGNSHNVTVVQLDLDAVMSWLAIPKVDAKTHLQAKITNASDYTFLPGTASIYVDGSFIARTQVPLVSPQESFDCPLGLDPSIRITYHPQNKKVSQSGLLSKTSSRVVTQRITIFNSKTTAVDRVKIIDQVPISEIPNVTPKLISPALTIPESLFDQPKKVPPPVRVGDGVVAQWEGADEPGFDVEALGASGKFYWMCAIPARGTVNLALQWEITTPVRTPIYGM